MSNYYLLVNENPESPGEIECFMCQSCARPKALKKVAMRVPSKLFIGIPTFAFSTSEMLK